MRLVEFPVAHSRVEHLDASGFPAVSIILSDGSIWPAWSEYRVRLGIGTQRSQARHIGYLIDFLAARSREFQPLASRGLLLQAWADALVMGTLGADGNDEAGLFWLPLSYSEAKKAVNTVTQFGDFLAAKGISLPLNAERPATVSEQIMFWRAWSYKKGAALLGHLHTAVNMHRASLVGREVDVRKLVDHSSPLDEVKRFPNHAIVPLLRDGFSARPPHLRWTSVRDQLITLLLHYGGRRMSEPLHMWVGDVEPNPNDPTRCVPWIHHPTDGLIQHQDSRTSAVKNIRRDQFLMLVYGLRPLTVQTGRRRVGFKNPLMEDGCRMRVYWSDIEADRFFWRLYNTYLATRPRVTRHPYLFITPDGEPMTSAAFSKVHSAAVRRLGLIAAKKFGTTPHGHRHAYASAAEEKGVPNKALQVALGHRAPASQEIYKHPKIDEIADAMCFGNERGLLTI